MSTVIRNRGSNTEISYASPLHTLLSGVLAAVGRPGRDGRKRRYKSSSEDSDEAPPVPLPVDGFITEDFRAGGPYLCSIPHGSLPVPKDHPLACFVRKNDYKFMDNM